MVQTAVVAGEDNCLFGVDVQFMGGGKLPTVVAPQGKHISKSPSRLHLWLIDLDDGEG